jgi:hypothetical protein
VPHTARGWLHKAGNDGFIELVEDADRGVLVSATAAGPNGGEVLGLLTLAVHAEVPVERLRQMIYAYPTFTEASRTRCATSTNDDEVSQVTGGRRRGGRWSGRSAASRPVASPVDIEE